MCVCKPLGPAGFDEVDVCDEDRNPGKDTENRGEVDKVPEDLLATLAHVHERKQRERCGNTEGIDRYAALIRLRQELRRVPL